MALLSRHDQAACARPPVASLAPNHAVGLPRLRPRPQRLFRPALVLLGAVAIVLGFGASPVSPHGSLTVSASASSQAGMAGEIWMIKSNDLQNIGGIGSYQVVACGTTAGPSGFMSNGICEPGQDPIYTSYATFKSDVLSGNVPRGSTVVFDNEWWTLTPTCERQRPEFYETAAALLAIQYGITLIDTPASNVVGGTTEELKAAAKYAGMVEIQAQVYDNHPGTYVHFVKLNVKAVRKVNPNVPIVAGLATDARGIPTTAADMYREWSGVRNLVQGFWLNANAWAAPRGRGCAPQGCPAVAKQFLEMIGGITAPPST